MIRVLVVEDEPNLREPLVYLLEKEGYEVLEADNGNLAVEVFRKRSPELILLDLMLPGISGNEVCRIIRQESQVPIIMITAKDTEIDKVVGLEIGADDYITKPYSTRELLARMRAVMRRGVEVPVAESGLLKAGPVVMDLDRHTVSVNGEPIPMPLKEFELLELLIENVNRVLTRGQIIDRVWGSNYFGDTKTLDVHVKRVRSKIEDDPSRPRHLITVRGLGYKFEA